MESRIPAVEERERATLEAILQAARGLEPLADRGFDAVDWPVAKFILSAPNPTPRQIHCLWRLLRKYQGQLSEVGVEYAALIPPVLAPLGGFEPAQPKRPEVKVYFVKVGTRRKLALGFAYDKRLVEVAGSLKEGFNVHGPKSWFDEESKFWIYPEDVESIRSVISAFESLEPTVDVVLSENVKEFLQESEQSYQESRAETATIEVPTKIPVYPFQKAGVKWIDDRDGRALIADEMGCIDGEAEVRINRWTLGKRMKLKDLFRRFQGWKKSIPTKIRACVNGELRLHKVVNVLDKGIKKVVRLTLASGKTLRLTPDHEVCVGVGKFTPAGDLSRGDKVLTNGKPVCRMCSSPNGVSTYKYAKFRGVCRKCMYGTCRIDGRWKGGKFIDPDGYVRVSGQFNHPRANTVGQVYEHILVAEKHLGRFVSKKELIHHKDGVKHHNVFSNFEITTNSKHAIHHGKNGGYLKLNGSKNRWGEVIRFVPVEDTVVSVKPDGEAHVYDIVCADPHRNFVANGILVHNCGKTPQALGYLALRKETALPALVLCPANLRVNWVKEAEKFTDYKCLIISAKTSLKPLQSLGLEVSMKPEPGYDLTIMNYNLLTCETLKSWIAQLVKGDKDAQAAAVKEITLCGRRALPVLEKELQKYKDMETLNRLSRAKGEIEKLDKKARAAGAPPHIKPFANDLLIEEFVALGQFKTVIADESHYLMDSRSQRSLAAKRLSTRVKNVIELTGTPVLNKPMELWHQTQMIAPKLFPNFMDYGKEFCAAENNGFGWRFTGASNLEKLEKILRSTIMIRRMKDQVLKELPPKTRVTIPVAIEAKMAQYRKETKEPLLELAKQWKEREEWKALMGSMGAAERKKYLADHAEKAMEAGKLTSEILGNIEKLKQIAVQIKFQECFEFILNMHQQEGKILVFVAHHETTDRLMKAFAEEGIRAAYIDGRVDAAARENAKKAFQEGDLEILVCGIRAAGEGLTLTASHTVVMFEFDWNPGKMHQAEDRTHRIGQTLPVTIYYLVAFGTIEEKIVRMIDGKREVANALLGESDRTLNEDGILDALLEGILEKK